MPDTISDLTPAAYNPRKISKEARQLLEKSLKTFGDLSGITINRRTGNLVCGHQRTSVLKNLSSGTIQWGESFPVTLDGETSSERLGVVEVDGKRFTVREVDWSLSREKAANVIANDIRAQGEFDSELLPLVLDEIKSEDEELFASLSFDELVGDVEVVGQTDADAVPEAPEEAQSKQGSIYQLGSHLLLCDDSTKEANLKRLMGDDKADLWITDPPYGVSLGISDPEEAKRRKRRTDGKDIANDSLKDDELLDFLTKSYKAANEVMKEGAVFYIWHADMEGLNFRLAAQLTNWKVRQLLIWKKSSLVMGRQDYQSIHEPCLFGWTEGAAHCWNSDRKQTTVLEFDKPSRSSDHPTMKPVDLFAYQINNSSRKNELVLDSFGGSGTTVIAAEQTGRRARVCELSPHYCDVIRRRWAEFVHGKDSKWVDLTPEVKGGAS